MTKKTAGKTASAEEPALPLATPAEQAHFEATLYAETEMLMMKWEQRREKAGLPRPTRKESEAFFERTMQYLEQNPEVIEHLLAEDPKAAFKRRTTQGDSPIDEVFRLYPDLAHLDSPPPPAQSPTPSATLSEPSFGAGLPVSSKAFAK